MARALPPSPHHWPPSWWWRTTTCTAAPVAPAVWFLVRMGIISLGAYGLYKATGVY